MPRMVLLVFLNCFSFERHQAELPPVLMIEHMVGIGIFLLKLKSIETEACIIFWLLVQWLAHRV